MQAAPLCPSQYDRDVAVLADVCASAHVVLEFAAGEIALRSWVTEPFEVVL